MTLLTLEAGLLSLLSMLVVGPAVGLLLVGLVVAPLVVLGVGAWFVVRVLIGM